MTSVKGSSVPIVAVGRSLLVSVRDDLDDRTILELQQDLSEAITHRRARGVIIDISALEIVDTFVGRMLGAIAQMATMLNARTIVVGMRPAVAMTLVELGMTLDGVETALDADRALARVAESLAAEDGEEGIVEDASAFDTGEGDASARETDRWRSGATLAAGGSGGAGDRAERGGDGRHAQ